MRKQIDQKQGFVSTGLIKIEKRTAFPLKFSDDQLKDQIWSVDPLKCN